MNVDELIQLMRLSGTDKVREYLHKKQRLAEKGDQESEYFLVDLEVMFRRCKRSNFSEAWPTMKENEIPTRPTTS